jgi:hypothetical protein
LSAKDLDIGLFRHLTAGLSPAKALQAIKVQMLRGDYGEQYRHPYYWAPFVLFGDGSGQEAEGSKQMANLLAALLENVINWSNYVEEKKRHV